MARVTVEDCLHVVENRFALCVLSVKRGRQLMSGARPLVEAGREKSPVLSLREVAADKVRFDRDLDDVLAGKYNPPKMDVKLVPAGTGKSAANSAPPSGGLF